MNRTTINEVVAIAAGTFGLALYAGLILVPVWGATRACGSAWWSTVLSLYVLAVLVGIGIGAAAAFVYFWVSRDVGLRGTGRDHRGGRVRRVRRSSARRSRRSRRASR